MLDRNFDKTLVKQQLASWLALARAPSDEETREAGRPTDQNFLTQCDNADTM